MLDKLKGFYNEQKTYVHIGIAVIAVIIGYKMFKK